MIDTKCLETLLAEVTAAIESAEERGLQNYLWLPLKPETLAEVQSLLEQYQRRQSLIRALARALSDTIGYVQAVLQDGYPDLPVSEVPAGVAQDLDENLADLSSARKGIKPLAGDPFEGIPDRRL